jgi:hypothetical protein
VQQCLGELSGTPLDVGKHTIAAFHVQSVDLVGKKLLVVHSASPNAAVIGILAKDGPLSIKQP